MKYLFAFLILAAALTVTLSISAKNNDELRIKVGETAQIHGLKVRFIEVVEDSRCPEDVQCIWAGNARVKLEINTGSGESRTVEINTNLQPMIATIGKCEIRITSLTPRPGADGKQVSDYVVGLLVSAKRNN